MSEQAFQTAVQVCKVDAGLGLVFGYAWICLEDGKEYFDLQREHTPEAVMLDASTDFMLNSRVAKAMHENEAIGEVVFGLPLTTDLAKSLEIVPKRTGFIIGMRPNAENLAKFVSGEYKGFSIGGMAVYDEVAE